MAITLLTTNAETNAASSSFTASIDSTYKLYIFKFVDVNPATDDVNFQVQFNVAGQSGYNEDITTNVCRARQYEDDSSQDFLRDADNDVDGTSFQSLAVGAGNGADESTAGELFLFNPSDTTYVTQFYATTNCYHNESVTFNWYVSGYINATGAVDEVQFKMSSGNMDAVIKLYGVG